MHVNFNVFFDPVRLTALLMRDGWRTEAAIVRRFGQWIIAFEKLRILAGDHHATFLDTFGGARRTGYCQVVPFPQSLQWA